MQPGRWQGRATCHQLKINDRGAHTKAREGRMWSMANRPAKLRSRADIRQEGVREGMAWVCRRRPNSEFNRSQWWERTWLVRGGQSSGCKAGQWKAKVGPGETKRSSEMRVSHSWTQATYRRVSAEAWRTPYIQVIRNFPFWNCSQLFSWVHICRTHFWNQGRPLSR